MLRVTGEMLIEASKSSRAEDMVKILYDQLQCNIIRSNDLIYELGIIWSLFGPLIGNLLSYLPARQWDPALERYDSEILQKTGALSVRSPQIVIAAAKNEHFDPEKLSWLIGAFSIKLNEEALYAIARRSWTLAVKIHRSQQHMVDLCATKFLEQILASGERTTWTADFHNAPLENIRYTGTVEISSMLIHAARTLYKNRKKLESKLLNCIEQPGSTVTQDGGRCIVRYFGPPAVLPFIKYDKSTADVVLSILDELCRYMDAPYNSEDHPCIPTDIEEKLHSHGELRKLWSGILYCSPRSREKHTIEGFVDWTHFASISDIDTQFSEDELEIVVASLLSDLPSDLERHAVDRAIHTNEDILVHVVLRVLGYRITCRSSSVTPTQFACVCQTGTRPIPFRDHLDPRSNKFLGNIIITWLKRKLAVENTKLTHDDSLALFIMDVPEMEGLSRAWPASNRVIESTASLLGAINSLCLHYLLVRSSDKKEVLEDLNRLIIRHYDYLPESIRGMRAEVIPEDLYMVAVTTEDRNCIEALRGILRCDGKWIPEIKHFEAAVCNETAAYDVFELLRERATKYNAKIFESSVIWKAVEIESKNSYIIFHHILGLVKDADLYGDFNIDGLEDFIKKHKKGEAKDLLLSVFEAWKTERESGRREVNKMIELGCGFDDEEEFAKWET